MALITYPNKSSGDTFFATEANEIKAVVNENYADVIDAIDDAVDDSLAGGPVAAALALKANIASPTFTGTVGGITKSMVGLGSVDNTSDAGKPVSTAQQTALDLKANLASPTFTGTVSGITKSMVGLGSVDNTADTAKPVSTAQQTAIDAKVANNLSPSTTVAPAVNAVNTALALKASFTSFAKRVALTGTQNGVNNTFGIPQALVLDSEEFFRGGMLQVTPDDYSISGQTITTVIPPESWETLRVNYIRP